MTTDLSGRLLIATPDIGEDPFHRAVVLVCAHDEDYAMGLILNKPNTTVSLPSLLDQLQVPCERQMAGEDVLDGGPVGQDRGFVLHSEDFTCTEGTLDVAPGVCMTATRSALHAIASEEPPEECVLALGYSGWGAGQLEFEISENAWLVGYPTRAIVFGTDYDSKWTQALDAIGVNSGRLQASSGRA